MYTVFAILIAIASVLLVGVILIQKSKGGGLAAGFNSYNQIGGVRKTTDFVEKATWSLAIFIAVLSIASAFVSSPKMVDGGPQVKDLPTTETQAPNFNTEAQQQPAGQQQAAPAQGEAAPAAPAQGEAAPAAPAK